MELTETLISSETVAANSFLDINRDRIRLPNGNVHERIVIRHPGAACVLAVNDQGQAVLVRQWRHAAGQAMLEVPAGKLDVGEDPAACALRELAEETPYTAQAVEKICAFYTAPGFCNEVLHLFRALGVQANSTLSADEDEFVQTELLDKNQVRAAIAAGEICDAKTLIALQFWLAEA